VEVWGYELRILHVSNYLPEYHNAWGGAEQAALRLIKAQKRMGYEISLATLPPENKVEEGFDLYPLKTVDGLIGGPVGTALRKAKRVWLPFDPLTWVCFNKLLRSVKPDVIHFHLINLLSLSPVYAAWNRRIPTVMSIYDYQLFCPNLTLIDSKGEICRRYNAPECFECMDPPQARSLHRFFLKRRREIFDFFLDKIDVYSVLSRSSAEILKGYGIHDERVRVIHQNYPLEGFKPSRPEGMERHSILLLGWVQERKGAHVLCEALRDVKGEFPDAKLFVAGELVDPAYKDRVVRIAQEGGIVDSVRMLGRVGKEELESLFERAEVVAVAEQWENMSPVVLVEAMARGKGIVAGNVGGIPEFIKEGKTGLLAEYSNPYSFADRIRWAFRHPDDMKKMGRAAVAAINDICDEKVILNEYDELYNGLASRRSDEKRLV
jgi:glycosyltransferase involved in cell wall biosynthesis